MKQGSFLNETFVVSCVVLLSLFTVCFHVLVLTNIRPRMLPFLINSPVVSVRTYASGWETLTELDVVHSHKYCS